MYVTNAKATVATDVGTGRQIWKTPVDWLPETPRIVCCGVSLWNQKAKYGEGWLWAPASGAVTPPCDCLCARA
jgi:hypothetical protein